ncbi:MAG: ATP-binding protein [Clostridia bacterium]|nr:ATP-binding protein [Clostridia bacterium]
MDNNTLNIRYEVVAKDFSRAGEASSALKKVLRKLNISPDIIRKVSIPMYEAEINMVIHANGGYIDVDITPETIHVVLTDNGPGIADLELAMQEGYSTATDNVRELGFGAGMGLPNIKKYSDDMKITTQLGKGTTVEIFVNIPA